MSIRVGDIVKCKVVGIQTFGAFVDINENYTGLIHISEISDKFVNSITDYITINEIIYAKVLEIDFQKKQLKLTIKNIKYRNKSKIVKVQESRHGFNKLKKMLPIFIHEKINEYISNKKA